MSQQNNASGSANSSAANSQSIEQKVSQFKKQSMKNIPDKEFIRIVRLSGACMIFAFLVLFMSLVLQRYTESIWFAVITVWNFALVVFGMCGARSRNFVGIFSLLHIVLSVAVLWFWFRTMNKIYWNYHDSWTYGELWLCFIFETVVLVLDWILYAHMQNIDLVYNANRGVYEFIANQQNEEKANDYGSTILFDNNSSVIDMPQEDNQHTKLQ
jgi:hypothetical protein